MDIKPLTIPLIKQHPKSDDCLRCCGLMVFRHLDNSVTKDWVWKNLHVYKKKSGLYGAFFTDLGIMALKRGYKVKIYHNDWHWWDEETGYATKRGKGKLIGALKKLTEKKDRKPDRKLLLKEIKFLDNGGKFIFKKPKMEMVDFYLKKKTPVILSVRGEDFYHSPKENYPHAILVIGKGNGTYILNDPFKNLKQIFEDDLYFSWVRTGGWMMMIEKT